MNNLNKCCDSCFECIDACEKCFTEMNDPCCRDCADFCFITLAFIHRKSPALKTILSACADLCDQCCTSCSDKKDNCCITCVDACKQHAEMCRSLI